MSTVIIILGLSLLAIAAIYYMWKRDAIRKEEEHERRKERFTRLMQQLREHKSKD